MSLFVPYEELEQICINGGNVEQYDTSSFDTYNQIPQLFLRGCENGHKNIMSAFYERSIFTGEGCDESKCGYDPYGQKMEKICEEKYKYIYTGIVAGAYYNHPNVLEFIYSRLSKKYKIGSVCLRKSTNRLYRFYSKIIQDCSIDILKIILKYVPTEIISLLTRNDLLSPIPLQFAIRHDKVDVVKLILDSYVSDTMFNGNRNIVEICGTFNYYDGGMHSSFERALMYSPRSAKELANVFPYYRVELDSDENILSYNIDEAMYEDIQQKHKREISLMANTANIFSFCTRNED